jgi:hypothetical protein
MNLFIVAPAGATHNVEGRFSLVIGEQHEDDFKGEP